MDDAPRVRIRQRIAYMRGDGHGVLGAQTACRLNHAGHVRAFDILHHDKEQALLRAAKVIHGHDAGVIQLGESHRLLPETGGIGRVGLLEPRRQDFDGHRPLKRILTTEIHRRHAAFPQQRAHLILRQHGLQLSRRGWLPLCRVKARRCFIGRHGRRGEIREMIRKGEWRVAPLWKKFIRPSARAARR